MFCRRETLISYKPEIVSSSQSTAFIKHLDVLGSVLFVVQFLNEF